MNAFDESKVNRDAGGKFDAKVHSTPEVSLAASGSALGSAAASDASTGTAGVPSAAERARFDELRHPTDADFEASFDTIKANIMNDSFPDGPNSWKTVMGARARRTKANIARFDEYIARVAADDPAYRAKHARYATVHAELSRAQQNLLEAHREVLPYLTRGAGGGVLRTLFACPECGRYVFTAGAGTAPRVCTMTLGCKGNPVKAKSQQPRVAKGNDE